MLSIPASLSPKLCHTKVAARCKPDQPPELLRRRTNTLKPHTIVDPLGPEKLWNTPISAPRRTIDHKLSTWGPCVTEGPNWATRGGRGRGSERDPIQFLSKNLTYVPKLLPRTSTQTCQDYVVTTHLLTLRTSQSKLRSKAEAQSNKPRQTPLKGPQSANFFLESPGFLE
jgi:hypothetical protein